MAEKQRDEEEDATTVAELKALVKVPGALRVITNEVHPRWRIDSKNAASPAKEHADLRSPKTYVVHNVVEIEGPDDRGRYIARTAEGDWTLGYPDALLSRLRQWRG